MGTSYADTHCADTCTGTDTGTDSDCTDSATCLSKKVLMLAHKYIC